MNNRLNARERAHLGRVKELPCSVCDAPGPSEAHHVKQGQRRMWAIKKTDEMDALNITVKRLLTERR